MIFDLESEYLESITKGMRRIYGFDNNETPLPHNSDYSRVHQQLRLQMTSFESIHYIFVYSLRNVLIELYFHREENTMALAEEAKQAISPCHQRSISRGFPIETSMQ